MRGRLQFYLFKFCRLHRGARGKLQYLLIRILCFAQSEGKVAVLLIQVLSFALNEGKVAVFTYSGFVVCSERGESCSIY